MCHVRHVNESWYTYEWVMLHTRMIYVVNESWYTYKWVMLHTRMIHVTQAWPIREMWTRWYVWHGSFICMTWPIRSLRHSPCMHVFTYACTSKYVYVCSFTRATHSTQAWPIREMMRSTSAVVRCAVAPLHPANLPKVCTMFRPYVWHSNVQRDSLNSSALCNHATTPCTSSKDCSSSICCVGLFLNKSKKKNSSALCRLCRPLGKTFKNYIYFWSPPFVRRCANKFCNTPGGCNFSNLFSNTIWFWWICTENIMDALWELQQVESEIFLRVDHD